MTPETVSIWIAIGLIAGQAVATFARGFGGFKDTIVGIAGACLGGLAFSRLHIPNPFQGKAAPIFVALTGAIALLVLLRLLRSWAARSGSSRSPDGSSREHAPEIT